MFRFYGDSGDTLTLTLTFVSTRQFPNPPDLRELDPESFEDDEWFVERLRFGSAKGMPALGGIPEGQTDLRRGETKKVGKTLTRNPGGGRSFQQREGSLCKEELQDGPIHDD